MIIEKFQGEVIPNKIWIIVLREHLLTARLAPAARRDRRAKTRTKFRKILIMILQKLDYQNAGVPRSGQGQRDSRLKSDKL
jgi:hypothetical protein